MKLHSPLDAEEVLRVSHVEVERDVSGLGASGLHCEETVTCVASPDRKDVGLLVGLEPVAVSRPIDEGLDTAGESLCDVSERRICWPLMQLDAELAADLRGEETTQAPGRGRSLTDLWHQISPQNKPCLLYTSDAADDVAGV